MNKEIATVPSLALELTDASCFAKATSAGEGDKPQLEIVCYSGKTIQGHWYWGDLTIDLDGMEFPKKKYPILEAHDTERKIAFVNGKPIVTKEHVLTLDPKSVSFLETSFADEFIRLSKEGFPYEASIRAYPTKIQFLQEKEEAEVNGFTVKGPHCLWRKSTFKEVSVCVFGYDDKTSAKAFADSAFPHVDLDVELECTNEAFGKTALQHFSGKFSLDKNGKTDENIGDSQGEGEKKKMTLEELRKEHPDLVTELTKEIETAFDKEKDSLVANFTTQLESTKTRLQTLEETNLSLEKKQSIRDEKDRQLEAGTLFDAALSSSKIPQTLYDKVKKQVAYSQFVKDGNFDVAAFKQAVTDEIKDWEDLIGDKVVGFGTSTKTHTDTPSGEKLEKEDDEWVKGMLSLSGQGQ